jgi:hypothetical protein
MFVEVSWAVITCSSVLRFSFAANIMHEPIIIDATINDSPFQFGFDIDGFSSAASVDMYQKACSSVGAVKGDCPDLVRSAVLNRIRSRIVSETCSGAQLYPLPVENCNELAALEISSGLNELHEQSRNKIKVEGSRDEFEVVWGEAKIPTFSDFEAETYRDLCVALDANALAHNMGRSVEGHIWNLQQTAEREAFVSALVSIDSASQGKEWLFLEIGFNAGISARTHARICESSHKKMFDLHKLS